MEEGLALITHLPGVYQSLLVYLYSYLQLPIDQLNMLVILVLQALIGCVWRRINNTFIRRLSGMVFGAVLMYSLYGIKSSFGLLLFIIAMYPIVKLKNARIAFWVAMTSLFLTFCYMAYFYYLSWRLDFTTSLMGCIVRIHTLTWDMVDFDKIKNNENLGNFKRFVNFRQKHACDSTQITFYTYMCYMLFFVHILCGSNLTINEYLWISDQTIYKREGWKDDKQYPEPSYKQIGLGVVNTAVTAGVYLIGKSMFSMQFILTDEFQLSYPLWEKMYVLPVTVFLNKFKYHFGWQMLDLSLITSGAGFSGVEYEKDGVTVKEVQWTRANNICSAKTALPQCSGDIVRYWNITVNNWLTYYVFYRVDRVPWLLHKLFGKRGAKVMITRIASALFHGVYPNYYFFFFWSAVFTNILDSLRLVLPTFEDEVEIKKEPQYAIKSVLLWLFWLVMMVWPIDAVGVSFMMLDIWEVFKLFNAIYWFPMFIIAFDLVVLQVLLRTRGIKQTEKDKRARAKRKKQ
eukprot:322974_1